jgi:hypothetical protein
MPAVERRRGVVLQPELDRFRRLVPEHFRRDRQAEIDARGDAAARDAVAIDYDPVRQRSRAEHR